jgi:hypothetical protein
VIAIISLQDVQTVFKTITQGHIAVFTLHEVVTSRIGSDKAFLFYSRVNDSAIRGVSWVSLQGKKHIVTASNDGRLTITDLKEPWSPAHLFRSLAFCSTMTTSKTCQIFFSDSDRCLIKMLEPDQIGIESSVVTVASQDAMSWSLDFSRHLPFVVATGADGRVRLGNINRSRIRGKGVQAELYSVNYSAELKKYEFLEAKASVVCETDFRILTTHRGNSHLILIPASIAGFGTQITLVHHGSQQVAMAGSASKLHSKINILFLLLGTILPVVGLWCAPFVWIEERRFGCLWSCFCHASLK